MRLLVEKKQMLLYSDSACSHADTATKQAQNLQTGFSQQRQRNNVAGAATVMYQPWSQPSKTR